ncbi:hypothetical protein [Gaoshiqia sediminis]|uniref:Uncharacterized protein n=1 Tax=Gaoshiqia sediminis TaxID=2986998 RepID=A0AA41Y6H8_9BACT|nr:hypothetical protein [Gaoshiqia sediminis]MCW0482017.1 hypothetical protein [Gaoshiqia sediminis]
MPYRRLPNTDQARMRAIETALEKGKRIAMKELAFSLQSLEKMQFLYPRLTAAIRQLNAAKQNQFDKSREYGETFKRAKLYISHFIQVMTFAIIREEIKPEARAFYGLEVNSQKIPAINLEKDVLEWGEKIISGEQKRCMHGGSPIYSPSIALVKVHYESFIDAYRHQMMLQNITNRASEQITQVREEADQLIQQVWNEIETRYSNLPDELKREKATDYGVTYFYRPAELKKMEADKLQTNLF